MSSFLYEHSETELLQALGLLGPTGTEAPEGDAQGNLGSTAVTDAGAEPLASGEPPSLTATQRRSLSLSQDSFSQRSGRLQQRRLSAESLPDPDLASNDRDDDDDDGSGGDPDIDGSGKASPEDSVHSNVGESLETMPPVDTTGRARGVSQAPLLVAGATTQEASERDGVPNSWSDGDASEFKVRAGPNYARTKRKQASKDSYYRQIGMDLFRNTYDGATRISNIGAHVKLPESRLSHIPVGCPFPRIIIFNIQVPVAAPKMFGKSDPDAGLSLVQYFEIKRSTLDQLEEQDRTGSPPTPSIALLTKFFREYRTSDDVRRRFKIIGHVLNMVEVGVPSMFQSYNGKPAIVFKTGTIFSGPIDGNVQDHYVEFDINVHEFAYLARKALHSMIDRVPQMRLRCAFVLQGEDDEELPEQVFACSALHNLDLRTARPVDLAPINVSTLQKRRTFA
ncbi:Protein ENHANCED DISEASE RESISTANCE 2 [Hondaea fermentalgiana]|uniref:Protein ENHANCED DISEASE RESISTANCE 2 n=1 Tax=Hondaea fermentalgiana TaxID=2315210 RepID=A0A2R5GG71_9STRA|nr:Protein ENHANCED DISEASE RESISTANCE 2 [Hondaea fermentalgiana]|eukprot:GBG26844.1 Protein ENHANCED DISEASE RESISTANCE 2 [Hondaea fermentalgiana]